MPHDLKYNMSAAKANLTVCTHLERISWFVALAWQEAGDSE